jgi:hypothetical protein
VVLDGARRAKALDRYWDALLDGSNPDPALLVEASDAALIAALQETGAPPGAQRAYEAALAQLHNHLDQQADALGLASLTPRHARSHATTLGPLRRSRVASNGHLPFPIAATGDAPVQRAAAPAIRSWRAAVPSWTSAAVLTLVVLAIGAVFVRLVVKRGDASLPHLAAVVDTIDGTPTSSPPLLRVIVPRWDPAAPTPVPLPQDDVTSALSRIDLFRLTLQPGTAYQDPDVDIGTIVTGVEQGTASVSIDQPARLTRRGESTATEVPAGSTTTLAAGDALVTSAGSRRTLRPAGAAPVTILELSVLAFGVNGGGIQTVLTGIAPDALPPGPFAMKVERIALPADGVLPLPTGATVLAQVEDGVVTQTRGTPAAGGTSPARPFTYRKPGYFVAASAADGASEVRAKDGPATLLVLTIAPSESPPAA